MKLETVKHQEAPATGELPYPVPPIPEGAPEGYRQFWQLWSEEKFFGCHEVLEEVWRDTQGMQKWFYNGLINCAVALYQHRCGNAVGAARQLCRAQVKLEPFRPRYYEVDIAGLLEGVEQEIELSLNNLSTTQRAQLPTLRQSVQARMEHDISGYTKADN